MFDFINYGAQALQIFLLVLMRASGLFLMAPVFGDRAIPRTVRVGLVILLSGIIVSAINHPQLPPVDSMWVLAGLATKEILVGLIIGLVFQLLFMGIKTGGAILGYQMGFAMVTVPDVSSADQVSIIARFWYLVAMLVFFSINGHHLLLKALADSYEVMPPGFINASSGVGELIIKYTAYVFIIAIKVAAPVMITLFLVDVGLGTIAKTMPTMNVFFVGFPIKIGAGLAVLALSLPLFSYVLEKVTYYLDRELQTILMAMGKA